MAQSRFANKLIVITGGSRGLGLEVAHRFADLRANIVLISRYPKTLTRAKNQLRTNNVHTVTADVAIEDQVIDAFASIEKTLGIPDILINNAGHGNWGAVVDTDATTFKQSMDVNFLGAVYTTAQVLKPMIQRGSGHIVNVASIAGRIGAPFEAAYSASKFALVGYTEALAAELDGSGITVSLITPGPINTEFAQRRGHKHRNGRPRPVSTTRVANNIVTATRRKQSEKFIPKWLRLAHSVKSSIPIAHRLGVRRMFADERSDLHRRLR